ncbi:RING-type domain-containing protein [Psidium guajava]|nr:RING-type domain-containing protein [Psidium guajava]
MAADLDPPQPDKILNYPQNGKLTFLFRKKLTKSDLRMGLVLTQFSTDHLRSLPRPLLDAITGDGLTVWCYTPAIHQDVVLRSYPDVSGFRFKKPGWYRIAEANRLPVGEQIDCWALYDAEDGPHGNLSFLIQPVGDSVVPREAASGSGGAETSSESRSGSAF